MTNHSKHSEAADDVQHKDPISGEPGARPVSTGLGAVVGGAAAGGAGGALAGPVGAVIGTVAGGIAGGLAGKGIAEQIDPTVESKYWNEAYKERDYYDDAYTYEDYLPAYRAGWETYTPGQNWENVEPAARSHWEQQWETDGGAAPMPWDLAQRATQDARNRLERRFSENKGHSSK